MISCVYDKDRLTADFYGHSGYDERGRDIVCAAVSVIAFSLAKYFGGYEKTAGGMSIRANKINGESRAVFNAFIEGLRLIENDFPDNLIIKRSIPYTDDSQERLQKG